MTISKLLSGLPARTMDQVAFDGAMAQLMTDLPVWGAEVNSTLEGLTRLAAGGVYGGLWKFDTGTADADPGAGKLRLSSATQNTSTVLRLDTISAGSQDATSLIDRFDDATAYIKGSILLMKRTDPAAWLTFDVLAVVSPTGYRNVTVVPTGGSAANPFTADDDILLTFQRGADLTAGALEKIGSATVTTPTSLINFLSLFSNQYEKYIVELQKLTCSSLSADLRLRLASGGVVLSTGYTSFLDPGASTIVDNGTYLSLSTNSNVGITGSFEIRNPRDATSGLKSVGFSGLVYDSVNSAWRAAVKEGGYVGANALSGFQLLAGASFNFTAGTVIVYGVRA